VSTTPMRDAVLGNEPTGERARRRGGCPRSRALVHVDPRRQAPGSRTVTSALLGLVREDPSTRSEFLALVGQR